MNMGYDEYGKWWWIVHDKFRSNLYFQSDFSEKYTTKFHISKKNYIKTLPFSHYYLASEKNHYDQTILAYIYMHAITSFREKLYIDWK